MINEMNKKGECANRFSIFKNLYIFCNLQENEKAKNIHVYFLSQ